MIDLAALRAWPKSDLHCHLDGSLRLSTVQELARSAGHPLADKTMAEIRAAVFAGGRGTSLSEYLEAFAVTVSLLKTEAAIRRVAREVVEDAAAEGVLLLELRFCPLIHAGVAPEAARDAALAGLEEGSAATGIAAGLILCAMRDRDPRCTERVVDLAVSRRGEGVLAVDLAGPEAGFSAQPHGRALRRAAEAGLGVTVHAGEADGPASVWSALDDCGARRIGHACRAVEDPSLLEALAQRGVTVEACPRSNVQTGAVAHLGVHPLLELRAARVAVAVATDNRLVTETSVTEELCSLAEAQSLGREALVEIVLHGFAGSFHPEAPRLRDEAAAYLAGELNGG